MQKHGNMTEGAITALATPSDPLRGHLKVNCPEGAREATLGCPLHGSVEGEARLLLHQCIFRGNDVFFFRIFCFT